VLLSRRRSVGGTLQQLYCPTLLLVQFCRGVIVAIGSVEYDHPVALLGKGYGMFGWLRRAPPPPTEQQRKVAHALADYPPYAPPEWNPDTKSLRDANVEYREYFFGSRQVRLEALRAFLAKFDVTLNLDDAGIMAVSAWFPRYADLLVEDLDDDAVRNGYHGFTAPWTGALGGLNPIFDLGIYYAECLWLRRTKLKWIVTRNPERQVSMHAISGLPGGKLFDPIWWTYFECRNIRNAKTRMQRRMPFSDNPWFLRSEAFTVMCFPRLRLAVEVARTSRAAFTIRAGFVPAVGLNGRNASLCRHLGHNSSRCEPFSLSHFYP
jgi:hypothetical protein